MARTPLHSQVQASGLDQFRLYAPPADCTRFQTRVDHLVVEGHTRLGAERIAWREWTEGKG
jgi:hypothetical protein